MLNMILVIKCFHLSPVMTRSNWPHYFVVFDFHIKFWSTERTDQREMKDPMCSPQNSISHNCGEKNISSRYRSKNRWVGLKLLFCLVYLFLCVFMDECMCMYMCLILWDCMCVNVRGKLTEVNPFFHPCRLQEPNSGYHAGTKHLYPLSLCTSPVNRFLYLGFLLLG